ncbi:SYNOVIOLIN-RELATED [Ceraceosorus bombacis]|uniref:SYNOVIOLIN-RELATED n=1 Tax=Ceraceosorus bombacis TaxID=401625 RepID=A0A0P1BMR5_9BASI|nr:SYNOVIOLIN-RELATED [Ceraceosorus bombacis]
MPAYRLLPRIQASTLDAFRKDIYRPRLALCILILFLASSPSSGPGSNDGHLSRDVGLNAKPQAAVVAPQPAMASSSVPETHDRTSASGPASLLSSIYSSLPLRAIRGASSRPQPAHSAATNSAQRLHTQSKQQRINDDTDGTGNDGTIRSLMKHVRSKKQAESKEGARPGDKSLRTKLAHRNTSTRTSSTSKSSSGHSTFRIPVPSLEILLHAQVLPALLPLHLIWALRLAGMCVEDSIATGSSTFSSRSRFSSAALAAIGVSLLLVASPWFSGVLETLSAQWTGWPDAEAASLLPLHIFVCLEALAALLSLGLPLLKVPPPQPLPFNIPRTIHLPSPSHSPALLEFVLPFLPPGVIDILAGRNTTRTGRRGRGRPAGGRYVAQAASPRFVQQPPPVAPPTIPTASGVSTAVAAGALPDQPGASSMHPRSMTSESSSPRASQATSDPTASLGPTARSKAMRLSHQRVLVSTAWVGDTCISLWDRFTGALIYAVLVLSLPTLSPASLAPLLALLALRSELGRLVDAWSSARSAAECLEFVRRRWGARKCMARAKAVVAAAQTSARNAENAAQKAESESAQHGEQKINKETIRSLRERATRKRNQAAKETAKWAWSNKSEAEVLDQTCSVCFESVLPGYASSSFSRSKTEDGADPTLNHSQTSLDSEVDLDEIACVLDCGHALHSVCLVRHLTAQAKCPACHASLSASPPHSGSSGRSRAQTRVQVQTQAQG